MAPVVDGFDPTWVLVSAGFDAHRADPVARLQLTAGDFADLVAPDRRLRPRAGPDRCSSSRGATTSTPCACRWGPPCRPLLDGRYRPETASTGGPGGDVVDAVGRIHGL